MRVYPLICAAIVVAMVPAAAMADDPRDPAMRSAAARARDSDVTRQLNLDERAMVRQRDARQLRGWHAARAGDDDAAADSEYAVRAQDYAARAQDHDRAMTDYARNRTQYEQDMAEWHRAVAACRAGDYSACDN